MLILPPSPDIKPSALPIHRCKKLDMTTTICLATIKKPYCLQTYEMRVVCVLENNKNNFLDGCLQTDLFYLPQVLILIFMNWEISYKDFMAKN